MSILPMCSVCDYTCSSTDLYLQIYSVFAHTCNWASLHLLMYDVLDNTGESTDYLFEYTIFAVTSF